MLAHLALAMFGAGRDWTTAALADAVEAPGAYRREITRAGLSAEECWTGQDAERLLNAMGCFEVDEVDRAGVGLQLRKHINLPDEDGYQIVDTGRRSRTGCTVWQIRREPDRRRVWQRCGRWDDDALGIPTGLPPLDHDSLFRLAVESAVAGRVVDDELPPSPDDLDASLGLAPWCTSCESRRVPGGGMCGRCVADERRL